MQSHTVCFPLLPSSESVFKNPPVFPERQLTGDSQSHSGAKKCQSEAERLRKNVFLPVEWVLESYHCPSVKEERGEARAISLLSTVSQEAVTLQDTRLWQPGGPAKKHMCSPSPGVLQTNYPAEKMLEVPGPGAGDTGEKDVMLVFKELIFSKKEKEGPDEQIIAIMSDKCRDRATCQVAQRSSLGSLYVGVWSCVSGPCRVRAERVALS